MWYRKFHLQHTLNDGNVWKGMINVIAENREDLPASVKGTYWASKSEEGWHGTFVLDNGFSGYTITHGVYGKHIGIVVDSMEKADLLIRSLEPIKYKTLYKFEGIIETDIYSREDYYSGYTQ